LDAAVDAAKPAINEVAENRKLISIPLLMYGFSDVMP
jgi:hypothetical protein